MATLAALVMLPVAPQDISAASARDLSRDANAALKKLLATNPAAKRVSQEAKAILVFPNMLKAGFMFGGQIGEGALLRRNGQTVAYYNSVAASYGLQAGGQVFGYALFLMTESAVKNLDAAAGFEVGVGPSFVLVDAGMAKSLTTSTLRYDVYGFVFDQVGAMAGLGIQGSKITRVRKR